MEDRAPELTGENAPNISSDTSLSISPMKEGVLGTDHQLDDNFSSPTPVKTKEPSRVKDKKELTELPDEFGALLEFFDRMTCSLRLLSLRRRTPSFQNISNQVEILTGRKFLFMHLAQIVYILPEAVQIDKILTHDVTTKCMKPDLNITLQFDIVKDHHEESAFLALSNLFLSRLRHFYITQPQNRLPEAVLPEPFNQRSITLMGDAISEDVPTSNERETIDSSHLPPNFKRCFYHNAAAASSIEKSDLISPVKSPCDANLQMNVAIENSQSLSGISVDSTKYLGERTPVKPFTGSNSLSVETPVQSTPTRPILPTKSVLTCEDENKANLRLTCVQSGSSAKKSLDFYSMGGKDTILSQKQISEFVLLIHQIFQSVNFCSITKEELVQKIIANNVEIDDQGEVEMLMERLEKRVPDWFYKKLDPSGDLLYRVKKVSDLNSVCEEVNIM